LCQRSEFLTARPNATPLPNQNLKKGGGGQIFADIFERPIFRRFSKKFQHFQRKSSFIISKNF